MRCGWWLGVMLATLPGCAFCTLPYHLYRQPVAGAQTGSESDRETASTGVVVRASVGLVLGRVHTTLRLINTDHGFMRSVAGRTSLFDTDGALLAQTGALCLESSHSSLLRQGEWCQVEADLYLPTHEEPDSTGHLRALLVEYEGLERHDGTPVRVSEWVTLDE